MKRWIAFAFTVIAGILAIVLAERQRVATQPGPQAVLSVASDAEHELSRIPTNLDRMSDADEIRIGDELARSYEARWKADQGQESAKEVEAYIQKVGAAVSSHATRKLPYRFHYVPQSTFVNAFALPGGHVFVGEGLLKLMQSEDALAAVLGHEVEHIDLRHCAERVQTEGRLRDLGSLGDLLSLPVGVFIAGYSKEQELEADRYGTALAVASNYSPAGILQLLNEFDRLERKGATDAGSATSPVDEAAQVSVQTLEDYFRSHPRATERKQQIEALARSQHWSTPPLRPLLLGKP
jgi:beta-barrel assembly-enhancing protease